MEVTSKEKPTWDVFLYVAHTLEVGTGGLLMFAAREIDRREAL